MEFHNNYDNIIASIEKSNGNDSVGSMWIETRSFHKDVHIRDIIGWAKEKVALGN